MLYLLFVTGISQGSTYFSMTVFVVSLASNDSSIVPSTQFLFSALYSKPEQTSSEYSSSVAVLLFKHNRPHCSDELTFKRNNVPLQNTRRIINQSKCLHKIHNSLERENFSPIKCYIRILDKNCPPFAINSNLKILCVVLVSLD